MSNNRILLLRQEHGWTQERLAMESGVGLRTVQRVEAGQDAGLETLTLLAQAFRAPVRDLFDSIDDEMSARVESLESRTEGQQVARDRLNRAWRLLYIGVGIIVTLLSFLFGSAGLIAVLAYWVGGTVVLVALKRLYLEPALDAKYPLSQTKRPTPAQPSDAPLFSARPE